jgi:hypothetical protein
MYYESVEAQLLKKQEEEKEIVVEEAPFTPSTVSKRKSSFVAPTSQKRESKVERQPR